MDFRTEATALKAQGFRVFPLHGIKDGRCTCGGICVKSAGKHPRIKAFQKVNATPELIEAWAVQYPNSNIAISTEHLVVIDIDDAEGELAREILPKLPATRSARTGRLGGMHRYYTAGAPHSLSVHALGGIDIRARGGYVVAPPSVHISGSIYEWVKPEDAIVEPPKEILDFLMEKTKVHKHREAPSSGQVPSGKRHDFLRREIFKRVASGSMVREEVLAVVDNYLMTQVEDADSVPESEISHMIDGAFRRKSLFRSGDLTESGLADMFVEYWKSDLVRLESSEWLQQNDGIWEPCVSPEILFKPVREVVYSAHKEGKTAEESKYVDAFHKSSGTWRFAEAVIKFSRPALTKKVNDFVMPPDTLPFSNGLLELVSGDFRPFQASDNVVGTMNCAYDPKSTCPKWEATIAYVTGGDPDVIRYHRQVFGYLLSTRTMRGVFFLVGSKATGKTTLISTLAEIVGERLAGVAQLGLIHSTKSYQEDEDTARQNIALVGKRFVFMDETRADAVIDPAKLKRIASRDAVLTARHLRYDAFQFVNHAKIVVLTNNQPNIDATEDAAWDRVVYLPFRKSIAKENRREGFKEELLVEASGILNWAIAGFQDYAVNGFVQPPMLLDQIQEWQVEDSPVAQFVEDMCILDPMVRATSAVLWEKYNAWKVNAGFDDRVGRFTSAASFCRDVRRLLGDKVESTKVGGKRSICGIAVRK